MPMSVGDKVVCVDFHANEFYGERPSLVPGLVYVVSEVGRWYGTDEDYVNLIGVAAPYKTVGWRASRFRKLEALKLEASANAAVLA